MTHKIYNHDLKTEITVDETLSEKTLITIENFTTLCTTDHYLTPKQLNDFIGVLLHVQAKKRKEFNTKY